MSRESFTKQLLTPPVLAILALPAGPALTASWSEGWESALAVYWAELAVVFIPVLGWFVLVAPFVATYAQKHSSRSLPQVICFSLVMTIPLWTVLGMVVLALLPKLGDGAL